ncbi:MAG TPA: acetoacetate--CoA ligase [Acidimicrobiales bacterium]|nr:acetoacetate--CoA ligase [Acidimicrobiales bacterium]
MSSPVIDEGAILWEPSAERIRAAKLSAFMDWVRTDLGIDAGDYAALQRWSVEEIEEFWGAIRRYFGVGSDEGSEPVLVRGNGAEHARWFPNLRLNYVDSLLGHPDEDVAVIDWGEERRPASLTYGELRAQAGAMARALVGLGVGPGDRVAAVMTNSVPAIVAFVATASIGAVWSSCAPEFGTEGMLDRFTQIEPTVLVAVAGYRYGGRYYPLDRKIESLEAARPTVVATVVVPGEADPDDRLAEPPGHIRRLSWSSMLAEAAPLRPVPVAFEHPLWILYSSGTTGLPKPIVQGHGGIVLEHLKSVSLHCDLGPGDRFFWFTTTGWMMWNFLVGGLLVGATILCYDGNPTWPDPGALWRMASELSITYFGTSAPFIESCRKGDIVPRRDAGATTIRTVGSTGAPLSPEGFVWADSAVGDDVLVASMSGGTDVCTGFLGACPLLPVRVGELQCAQLGAAVDSYDEAGRSVVGEVGELVITQPMPSMPTELYGDEDGSRLHDSYFATFPDVWRHGDWVKLTPGGGAVIYGRSDATLNRGGVRMGTAEFYRVIEALAEVADSLVVDTSELGREGELVLLVVPAIDPSTVAATGLSETTVNQLRQVIRDQLSPRHVPNRILGVPALPHTINGKRIEVPVRKMLLGTPIDRAVAASALDRPDALQALLDVLSAHELLPVGTVPS